MQAYDKYQAMKKELLSEFEKKPTKDILKKLQEINYRLDVLETIQLFYKSALAMGGKEDFIVHYKTTDAYISFIVKDRCYASPDKVLQTKRLAALTQLLNVAADMRKRFSSYVYRNPEQYKGDIAKVLVNILNAWTIYRDTYIEL